MNESKWLRLVVVIVTILAAGVKSQDPNSIIRDAINHGLGGPMIPPGTDFKVTNWHGGSFSHPFPGGSVSGSSYTGTMAGSSGRLACQTFVILISSVLAFLITNL